MSMVAPARGDEMPPTSKNKNPDCVVCGSTALAANCEDSISSISFLLIPPFALCGNGIGLGRVLDLRIGQAPVQVVSGDRSQLGMMRRKQRDRHVGDGDGLVAVIGHDEKDGEKAVPREIGGKDLGLLRRVVGIGGDGGFLVAMEIVRRIVDGSLRFRLHEALGG